MTHSPSRPAPTAPAGSSDRNAHGRLPLVLSGLLTAACSVPAPPELDAPGPEPLSVLPLNTGTLSLEDFQGVPLSAAPNPYGENALLLSERSELALFLRGDHGVRGPSLIVDDALDYGGTTSVIGKAVGDDFRDGILFVPEVLLAANAMKGGMAILRPLLAETGAPRMGKMVIGTVKGDIHDIGKNLVGMMMEGAGFDVVDLGINNPVENYLDAIDEHQPDIIGMSALLTTTMPYMKVVIDTMVEKGIRDDYTVLVGGAPLNDEFGQAIGADAYCRDAAVAVETAKDFMARRHNQRPSS